MQHRIVCLCYVLINMVAANFVILLIEDNMKPSPCLHPIHTYGLRGRLRLVPCGHCSACVVNKGRARTSRLEDDLSDYPYRFFVTLTFKDEYLPLAYYDDATFSLVSDIDCDYNGVVYSRSLSDCSKKDLEFVLDRVKKYGGVPVLSRRLVILFKKRFRYYFKKLFPNATLYIYSCGEYGPSQMRPHNHFIFGTDAPISTNLFRRCVCSAWSPRSKDKSLCDTPEYGRIDVQRINHRGCEDYTAQYLNCCTHLPKVLARNSPFRPFSSKSVRVSEFLVRHSLSEVREVFNCPSLYFNRVRHGKLVSEPVPACYKDRFFPVIPKFDSFAHYELVSLYRVAQVYHRPQTFYDSWKISTTYCLYNPLIHQNEVFDGRHLFTPEVSLQDRLIGYVCCFDKDGIFINDEFKQRTNFLRLYYISRRVCNNASILGLSVSDYVKGIEKYRYMIEQDKLKRFYSLQIELLDSPIKKVPLAHILPMYYNTDSSLIDYEYYSRQFGVIDFNTRCLLDLYGCNILECQRQYNFQSEGILLDTTKTKKRNDEFESKGIKKKMFIPYISRRLSNFIKIY